MNQQQLQEIRDRYITADGTVTLPPEVIALVHIYEGRPRSTQTTTTRANKVVEFVAALAGTCILLKDERAAKAALLTGFHLVNGANIIAEQYGKYCGCVCDIAERFGGIANSHGLSEIAARFGSATMCPSSPRGYRPSISPRDANPDDVHQCAIWWSMKFLKE